MLNGHTLENTFVVADFDRTLTHGNKGAVTSFGVFPRAFTDSEKIQTESKRLFDHYYPIEISKDILEEERVQHMRRWNEEVMELLGECIYQAQYERTLEYARKNIILRDGMKEGLQELGNMGIPVIVFSAGVSNVIEAVLNSHNIPFSAIHGNELAFRENRLCLVNQGVYIGNKGWKSLPNHVQSLVSLRTHKVILGDSLDDLHMGDPERVQTKIGFLNSEQIEKGRRFAYEKAFSHIVESDTSDNGILQRMIEQLKNRA